MTDNYYNGAKVQMMLMSLDGVFGFGKVEEIVESCYPAEYTRNQIKKIVCDLLDENLNWGMLEFVDFGEEDWYAMGMGILYKTTFSEIGEYVDLGHGKILHKSAFLNQISDKKNVENTKPKNNKTKECDTLCK